MTLASPPDLRAAGRASTFPSAVRVFLALLVLIAVTAGQDQPESPPPATPVRNANKGWISCHQSALSGVDRHPAGLARSEPLWRDPRPLKRTVAGWPPDPDQRLTGRSTRRLEASGSGGSRRTAQPPANIKVADLVLVTCRSELRWTEDGIRSSSAAVCASAC